MKMNPELKNAWDDVLFWARRLSYKQADNHPEWKQKYEQAVLKRDRIKEQLNKNK